MFVLMLRTKILNRIFEFLGFPDFGLQLGQISECGVTVPNAQQGGGYLISIFWANELIRAPLSLSLVQASLFSKYFSQ